LGDFIQISECADKVQAFRQPAVSAEDGPQPVNEVLGGLPGIRDGGAHGSGPGSDDHDGRGVGLEDAQGGRGVIVLTPDLNPPGLGCLTQRDSVNVVETQVCQ
jgi:hypothetical protein